MTRWGTLTSTSRRSDTVLKNDSDYRDVYHRQAKGLSLDGTEAVHRSDNGVPTTYDDLQTVRQTFAADGSLASDQLFTFVDAAGASYSDRTDQASFTRTTGKGTTTGTLYLTQVDSSSFGGFNVATQNRLDKSSSEDSSVHTQDAGWSLTVLSSRHISADKNVKKDALSWATGTSNTALDMQVQGTFSGAGVQTGGSSSRHSLTSGSDQGSDWSQAQGNGAPALTTSVGFRGGSSGETTSTLSFAADGSPSGNMAGSASSSTATDTITTLRGSGTLSGGSGTFDDYSHQEQQGTASSTTARVNGTATAYAFDRHRRDTGRQQGKTKVGYRLDSDAMKWFNSPEVQARLPPVWTRIQTSPSRYSQFPRQMVRAGDPGTVSVSIGRPPCCA